MMQQIFFQALPAGVWIVGLNAIGGILAGLTQQQTATWYDTLVQSFLTPPPVVFRFVWPALYTLLGLAGWLLWRQAEPPERKNVRLLFVIQLILNWCWPVMFFWWHKPGLSLLCIMGIITATTAVMGKVFQRSRLIALLLCPYLLWLYFAAYLNLFIWLYN